MDEAKYEAKLKNLQRELAFLQLAYSRTGRKGIIIFEGWDASGKGGVIRRIGWGLDPRTFKVWQIGPPSDEDRGRHWLYRFWTKIPTRGEITAFDRSWYGRVLVERVEGFAGEAEWQRAYDEINEWEQSLAHEGHRIVKLLLDITEDEQLRRFRDRFEEPDKQWKLTEEDLRNRGRRPQYERAYADMLERTSTAWAPWFKIDANVKRRARIEIMETILEVLGRDVDRSVPEVSPVIAAFFRDR